jgi:anti-anti-sigma factor
MKVRVDKERRHAVVSLPKKVIREQTAILSRELDTLLSSGVKRIVFDMEKTAIMDSASLGVLIYARKNYPAPEVEMVIAGASGYVREMLVNSGLTHLYKVENKKEKS